MKRRKFDERIQKFENWMVFRQCFLYDHTESKKKAARGPLLFLVGVTGFEPVTSSV